jgi:glycosyltransferase involved in cell wall biosynthesis
MKGEGRIGLMNRVSTDRASSRRASGTVSIALCTYNGERYLEEQLESFARQTSQPHELVVCDDGSCDGTVDIVRAFASTVSFPVHIRVNPINLGSSKNFAQAIQLCEGEFIALSDQDDVWLPSKLAVLSELLCGDSKLGGVFSDGELIDDNSREIGRGLWETFGFGSLRQREFQRDASATLLKQVIVTGATLMVRARARPLFLPVPPSWIHDGWMAWMLAIYSRLAFTSQRLIRYRTHARQQVGVGANSLRQKIRNARTAAAGEYLALANELSLLREHVVRSPRPLVNKDLVRNIEGKIEHCRCCAAMPANPLPRLTAMLARCRDYQRYSRPFRSMCKDFLGAF